MLQLSSSSSSLQPLVVVFSTPPKCRPSPKTLKKSRNFSVFSSKTHSDTGIRYDSEQSEKKSDVSVVSDSFNGCRLCSCGRRHLIGSLGASLLPVFDSKASDLQSESKAMLNKLHPARPDWYEELYALALDKSMKAYEKEIAGFKAELFGILRGKSKEVLELGIGTGPNLKYYAGDADVRVFGVDPNTKMEKYAQAAAISVGLPLNRFYFTQAVGEALPVSDASMDAVIGTLVLCSVKDVEMTLKGLKNANDLEINAANKKATYDGVSEVKRVLKPGGLYLFIEHVGAKDGTILRFVQSVADPLQQIVADGCHLTRETGKFISEAGFSDVRLNSVSLSTATLISPHVYGVAYK